MEHRNIMEAHRQFNQKHTELQIGANKKLPEHNSKKDEGHSQDLKKEKMQYQSNWSPFNSCQYS